MGMGPDRGSVMFGARLLSAGHGNPRMGLEDTNEVAAPGATTAPKAAGAGHALGLDLMDLLASTLECVIALAVFILLEPLD